MMNRINKLLQSSIPMCVPTSCPFLSLILALVLTTRVSPRRIIRRPVAAAVVVVGGLSGARARTPSSRNNAMITNTLNYDDDGVQIMSESHGARGPRKLSLSSDWQRWRCGGDENAREEEKTNWFDSRPGCIINVPVERDVFSFRERLLTDDHSDR